MTFNDQCDLNAMNSCELVSVVIPIHNAESCLRETLESLVSQTYRNIEIILVDDGSTDASCDIANEYADKDHRFTYVYQNNAGAGSARNHGLELARGKYVTFLDADDLFECQMIELMKCTIEADGSDACICRADVFSGDYPTGIIGAYMDDARLDGGSYRPSDFAACFYQRVTSVPWDKMFRLDPIRDAGIKYQNLKYSNDNFFVLTALLNSARISFIDDVLAHHRVGRGKSLRDRMYLDPLCDLKMLDRLRSAFFESSHADDSHLRTSIDSFTSSLLFSSYIRLVNQSTTDAAEFIKQLFQYYLPIWRYRETSDVARSSKKARIKFWLLKKVSPKGFIHALSAFDKNPDLYGGKWDRLRLYMRLCVARFFAPMPKELLGGGKENDC